MEFNIAVMSGDGIGPEISDAVMKILSAACAGIEWDIQTAGADVIEKEGSPLPERVLDSVRKNKVALKSPVTTPIGKGFRSVNVQLRKDLDLYANLRPCYNLPKSIKRITREASLRIAKFAFEYAVKNNRKEVCTVTKANICKLSDGLFLDCAREVAKNYPQITHREILVDNCCMQLVQNPNQFDVLLLPNLYGDIVSDLCAGLIGGLGVALGANIGKNYAVFEPVHGSAPDIAGQNKANPTAMLMSAIEMLKYIDKPIIAEKVKKALFKTLESGVKTADIGGNASCSEFAEAIIANL